MKATTGQDKPSKKQQKRDQKNLLRKAKHKPKKK